MVKALIEDNVTGKTCLTCLGIMLVSVAGSGFIKTKATMLQTEGGYGTCAMKRMEIAEHLRYLPMGYYNANSLGRIMSVTTNTMQSLENVATRVVMIVCSGLLTTAVRNEIAEAAGTMKDEELIRYLGEVQQRIGENRAAASAQGDAAATAEYDRLGGELRSAAQTGSLDGVRSYINENFGGITNGTGNDLPDGERRRDAGAGTGVEAGAVRPAESAGQVAGAQSYGGENGRGVSSEVWTSVRELGFRRGTEDKTIRLRPETSWSDAMRTQAERAAGMNMSLRYADGDLRVTGKDGRTRSVQGIVQGDNILVRSDSRIYRPEQTGEHEITHIVIRNDPELLSEAKTRLGQTYGDVELQDMVLRYMDIYSFAYGEITEDMTEDEIEALMDQYFEEIVCDAAAGIGRQRMSGRGAAKYTEEIRSLIREREGMGYGAGGMPGQTRYSIELTEDNRPFVRVEEDILDGVPESEWISTVKKNLKEKFPEGVPIPSGTVRITAQSRGELTRSGSSNALRRENPEAFADKLRATNNIDEILMATQNWIGEGLTHQRRDSIQEFARGNILFDIGGNGYEAGVLVGARADGTMLLYDIVDIAPTQITEKTERGNTAISDERIDRRHTPDLNDSITDFAGESKPKNLTLQEQLERGPVRAEGAPLPTLNEQLHANDAKHSVADEWERVEAKNDGAGIKLVTASDMIAQENKSSSVRVDDASRYTYDALTAKNDIQVVKQKEEPQRGADGRIDRRGLYDAAMRNLGSKNGEPALVYVPDVDRMIQVSKNALKHGADRRIESQAGAILNLWQIIRNSIAVNAVETTNPEASGAYLLIGASEDQTGNLNYTLCLVNEFSDGTNAVDKVDILYSQNTKKGGAAPKATASAPGNPAVAPPFSDAAVPAADIASAVSVADMLAEVKDKFPDALSQDVLDHFGITRPMTKLGQTVKYSAQGTEVIGGAEKEDDTSAFYPDELPNTEKDVNEHKAKQPTYSKIEDYQKAIEARAEQAKQERTKNISKGDFVGTEHLRDLGVKIEGSVGVYRFVDSMIANDKAFKSIEREVARAERRLRPSAEEREWANMIATGKYDLSEMPGWMDEEKVAQLADYYLAENGARNERIRQQRADIKDALAEKMESLFSGLDDEALELPRGQKLKNSMLTLNNRTPERNMRALFGDEIGEKINDAIFRPVAVNEAERYRFVNRMFDEVRTFEDRQGEKTKLTKEERALTQMVIEGKAVEETVASMQMASSIRSAAENIKKDTSGIADARKRLKAQQESAREQAREFSLSKEESQLAQQYARWLEAQELLDSGKADAVKINNAAKKYSAMFDKFYDAQNDFLVAHGYEPIGYIKGYAPHLQPESAHNGFTKAIKAMGINTEVTQLPSSIIGLTAGYKPNKRWNPFFLQRTTDLTDYDIASAYESYVEYMSDVLYHTDDIMRVRAAVNYFRTTYAPEEIRAELETANLVRHGKAEEKAAFLRARGVISSESQLSPGDLDTMLQEYGQKRLENMGRMTEHSNLTMWLDNYANILAGKQSMADRGWEYSIGRNGLNFGGQFTSRFAKANVGGNLSSVINQVAQAPQITAELGIKYSTKAIGDIIKGIFKGGLRNSVWGKDSDFLTGKNGIDYIVYDKKDMIDRAIFKPLDIMDGVVSTLAVRGKYLKELDAGKTHEAAMKAADKFGTEVMGSRMKGSKPTAYDSKNIVSRMVHIFQLEAVNSWEHFSQDLPRDFREIEREKGKGAAALALAGVLGKMLVGAFFINRLADEIYGGTPAPFDIFGLSANFIASGNRLTTNDYLKTIVDNGTEKLFGARLFDTESLDDEPFDWEAAMADTTYNIGNDIPFIRNAFSLLGWGDNSLPLPDLWGSGEDIYNAINNHGFLSPENAKAWLSLATEVIPGGRQIRKTEQGLENVIRGGKYSGYGEDRRLQYPIEQTAGNYIKAGLFGQYALNESGAYYAADERPLSVAQTQLYEYLVGGGVPKGTAYKAIIDYRTIANDGDLGSYEKGRRERELIVGLNMTDEQKLHAYEELTNASSRTEKFRTIMDTGLDFADCMDIYDEYARLDADETLKAGEKASGFTLWVERQDYSSEQKEAVLDTLIYYTSVPATASKVSKTIDAGLSADNSEKLYDAWKELTPEAGKLQVSELQKMNAAIKVLDEADDQMRAVRSLMDETGQWRLDTASGYGVTARKYVEFLNTKEEYKDYDPDGSSSNLSGAELKAALDSMSLTNDQKAVLWQLWAGSSKGTSNPYSTDIGNVIYDNNQSRKTSGSVAHSSVRVPRSAHVRSEPEEELGYDPYDGRGYYPGLRLPG